MYKMDFDEVNLLSRHIRGESFPYDFPHPAIHSLLYVNHSAFLCSLSIEKEYCKYNPRSLSFHFITHQLSFAESESVKRIKILHIATENSHAIEMQQSF